MLKFLLVVNLGAVVFFGVRANRRLKRIETRQRYSKKFLEGIKMVLNEALNNIDQSLATVGEKLGNLSAAVAAEVAEVARLNGLITQNANDAAALAAAQSEIAAATDRASALVSRVEEISAAISNTTAQALADDPAPVIPDLEDADPEVQPVEDGEEEEEDEDGEDESADEGEEEEEEEVEPESETVDPDQPVFGSR